MADMRSVFLLIIHLLAVAARLLKTGGVRSVIAENLLLRQQLIVLGRTRNKAPNLKTSDRFILGGLSLFISAHRRLMTAVIVRPSTLLRFHRALVDRKYSRLFSNSSGETQGLVVHASRTQSASLSVSRSTKISCGVFPLDTTYPNQATLRGPLGSRYWPQQRQPLEC